MPELNKPPVRMEYVHDAPVPMRDGTILRGDVYRPVEGARPVVLMRSPYGEGPFRQMPVVPLIDAGFAVVLQHCRGRGSSDGEFRPWLDEGPDGFDTIEWIAAQPWCDGNVVMAGGSYLAGCGLQAAAERPPALKGVYASITPADFYEGLKYAGGAFALGSALMWGNMQNLLGVMHAASAGQDVGAEFLAALATAGDQAAARRTLPLDSVTGVLPQWADWVGHPSRDEYWRDLAESLRQDRIEVPVMHVAGWFDLFLWGTLENHRRIGGPLVVGPWSHLTVSQSVTGQLDFGFQAGPAGALEQRQVGFLRAVATGGPVPGPPVRIFVMGDDVWRDEQEWPLARTVYTPYHLRPGGGLSPGAPPAGAAPSAYTFDPRDPVPTNGGGLLLPEGPLNVGPRDQREIGERPDVLAFTTDVLEADLEVTGPVKVVLYAATSAADTDWTAKLVNVWPDGRAMNVADGIVRARHAEGADEPRPVPPGEVRAFEIDLVATSQVFKAGHRLRVEISSSNFPRFDVNPGTGGPAAGPDDLVVQHQQVFHDASRPSHILLPVIPR